MSKYLTVLLFLLSFSSPADDLGDALLFNVGYGPQPGSSQTNASAGIDYEFYRYHRSERQMLSLGLSYTYLATDHEKNTHIHAISIYPQLSLFFKQQQNWKPWFFVRALAPSYLSDRKLGEREQAKSFAFQAQVGLGMTHIQDNWMLALSYKHFSNANLWKPNDGFDVPLVFNIGKRF